MADPDAIVVGSGPNGLAAAITLAQVGCSVLVLEAQQTIGGATRSAELTLPGFVHDVCSAVHPMALASPFFRNLPLGAHGLQWIHPPAPLAHPLDDGRAAILERSLAGTAATLGEDAASYLSLMHPLVADWDGLVEETLRPLRWPRHPLALARFGLSALRPARSLALGKFRAEPARALLAGCAAHCMLPLEAVASSAVGLILLAAGHAVGWPIPRGGSKQLALAMASYLRALGGRIETGVPVRSLEQLPQAAAVLFDVTPRQLLKIAGRHLPQRYARLLQSYRYGMAAYKVDWALAAPVPWRAADCGRAGTVHLGGGLDEIAASERDAWNGRPAAMPFVLVSQPTLFDSTRAPAGKHILWAYCHLPHGSDFEMVDRMEAQIERFAPGFRERVLARSVLGPAALEARNENLVGGDINGGRQDLRQIVIRPTLRYYSTPLRGLYLCSSSTPPGGGVHGMCGHMAARMALRREFR